eukprot:2855543-Pyramimonas_sp.AAC.1
MQNQNEKEMSCKKAGWLGLRVSTKRRMSQGDDFIRNLLESDHKQRFKHILQNSEAHRLQILLSVVRHDAQGRPYLERQGYRLGEEYFYPASAVKACAVVAAMQTLREQADALQIPLGLTSRLVLHPSPSDGPQAEVERVDESNVVDRTITVAHEVRKLFLVSDNPAFNRLYNLVGQRKLNECMWNAGLGSVRLRHRLYDRVPVKPPDE